jgi:hypothetical protein
LLLTMINAAPSSTQMPLPILRGIVLIDAGHARAYFEDPESGTLTAHAPRDIVGDSEIEQIQEDRVILRRGSERVHMLLGGPLPAGELPPLPIAIIASGQPWLDHLGIPPQAFSRAIERALPAQGPDNLED